MPHFVCWGGINRRHAETYSTFKDIPALPTSQVYRKIQNACQKSEN